MPKDPTKPFRLLLALPLCVLLVACQTTVTSPPAECSRLIPDDWKKGVAAVPLPGFETVGEVLTAFVDQSARLQMANDRTRDTITIVERCETMVNEARPRKRILGIF